MINRAGLGVQCSLCSNWTCTNFGHCIHTNHYNANRRPHTLVQYDGRARQHHRIYLSADLRTEMCRVFHPRFSYFTEEMKDRVFNGDDSIDWAPHQPGNEENQDPQVIENFMI